MVLDLDDAFGGTLGESGSVDERVVDEVFGDARRTSAKAWAESLKAHSDEPPFDGPTTPIDAPPNQAPPLINAVRNLWLARFNPGNPDFVQLDGSPVSDVNDDSQFPWQDRVRAVRTGNFWLSTTHTPKNRTAIEEIAVGDLVVIQRSDPRDPVLRGRFGATSVLIGVAIVESAEEWKDTSTGRRERRISLSPAGKFEWPIPRSEAKKHRRLVGRSFKRMPQRPDGTGAPGFTLSAIALDDWAEMLAVCGIHPEAMSEPDLGRLEGRLRATAKGNHELWRFRWDHVFQHSLHTAHEQAAIQRCRDWAKKNSLLFRSDAQRSPNAGYDLLFVDASGKELQVEVKGYTADLLAQVNLQPSQAKRAQNANKGNPPDWKLFAVLKVHTKHPVELVKSASEVVQLINTGGIRVKDA